MDKLTYKDFAAKIKAKYPQYGDVEDSVLVEKILAKYPQYADQVETSGDKGESVEPSEQNVGESQIEQKRKPLVSTPEEEFLSDDEFYSQMSEPMGTREDLSFRESKPRKENYMGLFNKKEDFRVANELGTSVSFMEQAGRAANAAQMGTERAIRIADVKNRIKGLEKNFPELSADVDSIKKVAANSDVLGRNIEQLEQMIEGVEQKAYNSHISVLPGEAPVEDAAWTAYENVRQDPNLIAANEFLEQDKKLKKSILAERETLVGKGIEQYKKYQKGAIEGLADYLSDYTSFQQKMAGDRAVTAIISKLNKLDAGQDVDFTTEERILLKSMADSDKLGAALADKVPMSYKIGEAVGGSIGFMAEFLLTSPTGVGPEAAVGRFALKQGIKRAPKIGINAMAKLAGAGVQAVAMPSFYAKAAERVNQGEDAGSAFLNSYWETAAETLSEKIFLPNPAKGNVAGGTNRLLNAMGINFDVNKGAVGVAKNIIEESAEEKISEIFNAPKDYDSFGEFWDGFTDKEQNIITFGSVAALTGGMGAVAMSGNAASNKLRDMRISRVSALLPTDLRAELDIALNDTELSVKDQFDLVAKTIEDRINARQLGDNPAETVSNAMRYAYLVAQKKASENVDKKKPEEIRAEVEEVSMDAPTVEMINADKEAGLVGIVEYDSMEEVPESYRPNAMEVTINGQKRVSVTLPKVLADYVNQQRQLGKPDEIVGDVPKEEVVKEEPEVVTAEEVAPAEEPAPEQPKVVTPISSLIDRRVNYKGEEGELYLEGEQIVFETSDGKITELGTRQDLRDETAETLGVEPAKEREFLSNEDGTYGVYGNTYSHVSENPVEDVTYDDAGNVVNVRLADQKGNVRTFRGNTAEQLAYEIALNNMTDEEVLNLDTEITTREDINEIIERSKRKTQPEVTGRVVQGQVEDIETGKPAEREQVDELQQEIDKLDAEISEFESLMVSEAQNKLSKSRLVEHNGFVYLVEKTTRGGMKVTLNGGLIKRPEVRDAVLGKYESEAKEESDALLDDAIRQLDEYRSQRENEILSNLGLKAKIGRDGKRKVQEQPVQEKPVSKPEDKVTKGGEKKAEAGAAEAVVEQPQPPVQPLSQPEGQIVQPEEKVAEKAVKKGTDDGATDGEFDGENANIPKLFKQYLLDNGYEVDKERYDVIKGTKEVTDESQESMINRIRDDEKIQILETVVIRYDERYKSVIKETKPYYMFGKSYSSSAKPVITYGYLGMSDYKIEKISPAITPGKEGTPQAQEQQQIEPAVEITKEEPKVVKEEKTKQPTSEQGVTDGGGVEPHAVSKQTKKELPDDIKFLEQDLPSRVPTKAERKSLDEKYGEIDVKPIHTVVKPMSEDDALLLTAAKDDLRPLMNGVFYDAENQVKVSNDAYSMVVIPSKITGESRTINPKTGKVIEGKYPDYRSVVPKHVIRIRAKLSDIISVVSGVEKANRFLEGDNMITITFGDKIGNMLINPYVLMRAIKPLMATGTNDVIFELGETDRAIVIRDAKNERKFGLVMPITQNLVNTKTIDLIGNLSVAELEQAKRDILKRKNIPSWGMEYHSKRLKEAESENNEWEINWHKKGYDEAVYERDKQISDFVNAIGDVINSKGSEPKKISIKQPEKPKTKREGIKDVTPKETDNISKATGIKPKNLRDVYKAGREVFGLNKAQALAQAVIVDRVVDKIAKTRGVSKQSVYSTISFVKSGEQVDGVKAQGAKGAIQFLEDGNAIIHALTDPNVSTPIHEIAHLYEKYMTGDERSAVLKWAGHKKWSVNTSEMFARGFEKYLSEGVAPTTELKKIFDRFKKWMVEIYNGITGSDIDITLNDAMMDLYAQMLGAPVAPKVAQAAREFKYDSDASIDELLFQRPIQKLPPTIKVNGKERPTTNNLGNQIHPTEEGVQAFWEWFGDSKVVDEQGRPMVVYHGTDADFDNFEKGDIGFHFGTPYQANNREDIKSILPVYLRIINPIRTKDLDLWSGVDVVDSLPKYFTKEEDLTLSKNDYPEKDVRDILLKKGIDGIVYLNRAEMENSDDPAVGHDRINLTDKQFKGKYKVEDSWIALIPTQIKSATGNQGTFDPENPSILFQGGNHVSTKDVESAISNYSKHGLLYHGTSNVLQGGLVLPPSVTGVISETGRLKNRNKVFFTKSEKSANIYAGRAVNSIGGTKTVARVVPVGDVTIINDKAGTEVLMSDYAIVVPREVTDVEGYLMSMAGSILFQETDPNRAARHTEAVNKLVDKFEREEMKDVPFAVRGYLSERGNPVSEDIINNVLKSRGYAKRDKGSSLQDKGDETREKRGQRDSDMPEIDRSELQDGEKAEEKVSRWGARFFSPMSRVPQETQDLINKEGIHLYTPTSLSEADKVTTELVNNSSLEDLQAAILENKMNEAVWLMTAVKTMERLDRDIYRGKKKGEDVSRLVQMQLKIARSTGKEMTGAGLIMRASQHSAVTDYVSPITWVQDYIDNVMAERKERIASKWFKRSQTMFEKKVRRITQESVESTLNDEKVKKAVKKATESKEKPTAPKEKSPAAQKRDTIMDRWRESVDKRKGKTLFQAARVMVDWVEEDLDFARELINTYLEEGVYSRAVLTEKVQKAFRRAGVSITDDIIGSIIPSEYNNRDLDELFEEDQLDKAAQSLARRIFGEVVDKEAKADDPMKQMVNTLTSKFKEREKKPIRERKSDLDKIAEAIRNVTDYKEVWTDAKTKALDMIAKNKDLSDTEKEIAKQKVEAAYDSATKFTFTENQVRGAVRKYISDNNIDINTIIRSHLSVKGATLESIKQGLIDMAGLDGYNAEILAQAVSDMWERTLRDRSNSVIAKETLRMKKKADPDAADVDTKIRQTETERLLDLILLGAFDDVAFRDAYAAIKGIPTISEKHAKRIEALAEEVRVTPSPSVKRMRKDDLLRYMRGIEGVSFLEGVETIWYGSVLSGMPTQVRNTYGAFGNVYGMIAIDALTNPLAIPGLIKGQRRGMRMGRKKARIVLKTGKQFFENVTDMPSVSEFAKDKSLLFRFIAYLLRFMSANDQLALSIGKEALAQQLAEEAENVNRFKAFYDPKYRRNINRAVNERLSVSAEKIADIERLVAEEAKEYGYNEFEQEARRQELVDEARPIDLVTAAENLASRATGNTKAYGTLGYLIENIASGLRGLTIPVTWKGKKYEIKYAKFLAAFTRISTNVATFQLGYTPFGLANALIGRFGFIPGKSQYVKELSPRERRAVIARSAAGTVIMALLYSMLDPGDDDHWLQITANGTGNYKDEAELRKLGWRPYSIYVFGKRIPYRYSPFALMLAPLGYMSDHKKYVPEDKDVPKMELLGRSMFGVISYMADNTPLRGMLGVFDSIINAGKEISDEGFDQNKVFKIFANMVKGFYAPGIARSVIDTYDFITRHDEGVPENNARYQMFLDRTVFEIVPWPEDNFPKRDAWGLPVDQLQPLDEFFGMKREDAITDIANFHYSQGGSMIGEPNRKVIKFWMFYTDGSLTAGNLSRNEKTHRYLWNEVFMKTRGEHIRKEVLRLRAAGFKGAKYLEEFEKSKADAQQIAKDAVERYTKMKPLPMSMKPTD